MGLFHDDDASPYQGASTTAAYALWQLRRGGGTGTNNVPFVPATQAEKSANDLRLEAEEKDAIAKAIAKKAAKEAAEAQRRYEAEHWEEICASRAAAEAAEAAAMATQMAVPAMPPAPAVAFGLSRAERRAALKADYKP